MTNRLNEDDIYRTSTQYRLWSFSPEQLAARRKKTHNLAVEQARQYAGRTNEHPQNGTSNGDSVEHLTEEEESRLIQRYCDLIRTTSDHLQWPSNVKATAVQYLKRFYLSNSCMTYPPKEIYKTVLFLASKTEAVHVTLSKYAHRISADPDAILAPEYKVMQALRFTLDVRQPFRGLKGVLMELLNISDALMGVMEASEMKSGEEVQEAIKELPFPPEGSKSQWQPPSSGQQMDRKHIQDRIQAAYAASRTLLDAPASLTDVYFLYTPSQIVLAAMSLADKPLTLCYLDTKLTLSSPVRPKILATIHDCAAMMADFDAKTIMSKDERAELEKKLERCRDPTTKDLVKIHAESKRNGAEEGKVDDQEVKRRKLERANTDKEMDDLFGPNLSAK